MDLAAVMQEIADQLDTIPDLRPYGHPVNSVHPPAAVVAYPDEYAFDATYGRGSDRITLPVWIVVGGVYDRAARDNLGAYADGSGARSVKAVLEAGTYTEIGALRVMSVDFDTIRIAGTDYIAAGFNVDITGSGS